MNRNEMFECIFNKNFKYNDIKMWLDDPLAIGLLYLTSNITRAYNFFDECDAFDDGRSKLIYRNFYPFKYYIESQGIDINHVFDNVSTYVLDNYGDIELIDYNIVKGDRHMNVRFLFAFSVNGNIECSPTNYVGYDNVNSTYYFHTDDIILSIGDYISLHGYYNQLDDVIKISTDDIIELAYEFLSDNPLYLHDMKRILSESLTRYNIPDNMTRYVDKLILSKQFNLLKKTITQYVRS